MDPSEMAPSELDADQREREIRRIDDRIVVIANWLIQGRCGDDADCAAAKQLEIDHLRRRRDALVAASV
jgi:hypothetical protein